METGKFVAYIKSCVCLRFRGAIILHRLFSEYLVDISLKNWSFRILRFVFGVFISPGFRRGKLGQRI